MTTAPIHFIARNHDYAGSIAISAFTVAPNGGQWVAGKFVEFGDIVALAQALVLSPAESRDQKPEPFAVLTKAQASELMASLIRAGVQPAKEQEAPRDQWITEFAKDWETPDDRITNAHRLFRKGAAL